MENTTGTITENYTTESSAESHTSQTIPETNSSGTVTAGVVSETTSETVSQAVTETTGTVSETTAETVADSTASEAANGESSGSLYILGALFIAVIIAGIVLRLVKRKNKGAKRYYRQAMLVKSESEIGEVTDGAGNVHRGPIAMHLTFQFKNGETKTFTVDNKVRGKCSANEWGNLMYEGEKLLKFESPSGAIGTKLYVSKNVAKTAPPPQDAPPNRFKKDKNSGGKHF